MTGDALARVERALEAHGSKRQGRDWECPGHDDRNASLSVSQGDRGAVIHCHAGCETEAVVEAMDLTMSDMFDEPKRNGAAGEPSQIVDTYDYTDEAGKLLYQVVRKEPKTFRQRRPDGAGGWIWNLSGVGPVPYHLPEVVAAVAAGDTIWIAEGEKDVDAIRTRDCVATCNSGGAEKWPAAFAHYFEGSARVVVVADKDERGYKHAQQVAEHLRPVVQALEVVEAVEGKDAAAALANGRGMGEAFRPIGRPRVATIDEVLADEAPPAIVKGLLFRGATTSLVGIAKRGKTYAASQLALCVASGRPFLGLEVARARVLYVTFEVTLGPLFERFRHIARDTNLADPERLYRDGWLTFYGHQTAGEADPLDLVTGEGWSELAALIDQGESVVFIIDTVSKVAALEPRDTLEWQAFAVGANRFCRERGLAGLMIDHAHSGRIDDHPSVAAFGNQAKGSNFATTAKLVDNKADDPLDLRWKLEADSWYGDFGAAICARRPEINGRIGSGLIRADVSEFAPSADRRGDARQRCGEWLRDRLAGGVSVERAVVVREAAGEGFNETTLTRAAEDVGVTSDPIPGARSNRVLWSLNTPYEEVRK